MYYTVCSVKCCRKHLMAMQGPSHEKWMNQTDMNPQPPSIPDPRPLPDGLQPHSCAICQRRKVKCDRTEPCSNCVKHRVVCEYRPPAPPRRRKRQSPDPQLQAKMRRYEDILQRHGVKVDELNGDRNPDGPTKPFSPFAGGPSDSPSRCAPDTPEKTLSTGRRKPKPPQR